VAQPTHHQALVIEPGLFGGVRRGQLVQVLSSGKLQARRPGQAEAKEFAAPVQHPKLLAECTKCRQPVTYIRESIDGKRAHLKRHGDHSDEHNRCGTPESEDHLQMKQRIIAAAEYARDHGAPIDTIEEEPWLTETRTRPDVAIYRTSAAGPQPAIAIEYQRSAITTESLATRTASLEGLFPLVIWLYNEHKALPNATLARRGFAVDATHHIYLQVRRSTWRPGSGAHDDKLGVLIRRLMTTDHCYWMQDDRKVLTGRNGLANWQQQQIAETQNNLKMAIATLNATKSDQARIQQSIDRLEADRSTLAESHRSIDELHHQLKQAQIALRAAEDTIATLHGRHAQTLKDIESAVNGGFGSRLLKIRAVIKDAKHTAGAPAPPSF